MTTRVNTNPYSGVYADPALQKLQRTQGVRVYEAANGLGDLRHSTFDPQKEKYVSVLLAVAAAAATALSVISFVVLSATGVGAGLAAVAGVLALVALYVRNQSEEHEAVTQAVGKVYEDAFLERYERNLDVNQRQGSYGFEMSEFGREEMEMPRPQFIRNNPGAEFHRHPGTPVVPVTASAPTRDFDTFRL